MSLLPFLDWIVRGNSQEDDGEFIYSMAVCSIFWSNRKDSRDEFWFLKLDEMSPYCQLIHELKAQQAEIVAIFEKAYEQRISNYISDSTKYFRVSQISNTVLNCC